MADDNEGQIWTHRLSDLEPILLSRGGGGGSVVISPDGAWVGFNDSPAGLVRRVSVEGGSPETLGPTGLEGSAGYFGADWTSDGAFVFATAMGLRRLSVSGGEPEVLTSTEQGGPIVHGDVRLLPDHAGVVYTESDQTSDPAASRIRVRWFDGREAELGQGHSPRILEDGVLVFSREAESPGALWAARLNRDWTELASAPVRILDGLRIETRGIGPSVKYDLSTDGTLIALPDLGSVSRKLVLIDRAGNMETLLDVEDPQLPSGSTSLWPARFSPDGDRIAFRANYRDAAPNFRLFVSDVERRVVSALTVGLNADWPVWTPDGQWLAFNRFAVGSGGEHNLYWARADNVGPPEPLIPEGPLQQHAQDFSPDGRHLVFAQRDSVNAPDSDLMVLALEEGNVTPIVASNGPSEKHGDVSPDGRWLAYVSDESGQDEVYVTAFPEGGTRTKVSTALSESPVWGPQGDELFYVRMSPRAVMVVDVRADSVFAPGPPRVLFEAPIAGGRNTLGPRARYAPGRRALPGRHYRRCVGRRGPTHNRVQLAGGCQEAAGRVSGRPSAAAPTSLAVDFPLPPRQPKTRSHERLYRGPSNKELLLQRIRVDIVSDPLS